MICKRQNIGKLCDFATMKYGLTHICMLCTPQFSHFGTLCSAEPSLRQMLLSFLLSSLFVVPYVHYVYYTPRHYQVLYVGLCRAQPY